MGRADDINRWWEPLPGERYWLDATTRDEREELLAAPRGDRKSAALWTHRLITHVRNEDIVFRYDSSQGGISGWSSAGGRVKKQNLSWPHSAENGAGSQQLPSWGIGLRQPVQLRTGVTLAEVARVQWNLFPAMRALEDRSGGPLYFPFEMGRQDITRPLAGYVFKLPAVFVRSFTEFTGAVEQVARLQRVSGLPASPLPANASPRFATSR
jgi:hypothetical protein